MDELLIAANPDPDSRLRTCCGCPLGGGMVFRTSGTWPRTKALYCHPVDAVRMARRAGDRRAHRDPVRAPAAARRST